MKSSIDILRYVLTDVGMGCGLSTDRDWQTIRDRFEDEGESFATITLPNFAKAFEQALEAGSAAHTTWPGFKRSRQRKGLPMFLRGFLELVFEAKTCDLKDKPSVEAIQAIRQVCLLQSKIELPCKTRRIDAAFRQYVQTEQEVALATEQIDDDRRSARFVAISHLLWDSVLSVCERKLVNEGIVPKHGPGTTADDVLGNAKYENLKWTDRLEKEFPHWEAGILVPSESFLDRLDSVTLLSPGAEPPVKVVAVPKTLKTPRIIAKEPVHMQYVQQGLLRLLRDEFKRDNNSKNFVMFESSEPNQQLALEGSIDGSLATLDLSEASDRVSNQHVELLLSRHANLKRAVAACRSTKADVPGFGVLPLTKFASMGSALTFPMECMVFMTVIFCGIERAVGRKLTKKDIKSFYGRVRVFGDDIIVPKEFTTSVISELEAFGFRVNVHKSFWNGKFRESCGAEFYAGEDVTVVRQRSPLPNSRKDSQQLISTIEFRNLLYWRGLWSTVAYLDEIIGKYVPFPIVESTSVVVGRSSCFGYIPERWDVNYHSPLVKGVVVDAVIPKHPLEDYPALMKWFLSRGEMPCEKDLLVSSGRPRVVRLKTRLAQPF